MSDEALRAYLRAIARIPRLTPEEERGVAELAAAGDAGAQQRLVEANLRFVVSYAKRYRHMGVPLLDLVHEGNLGLMEAARRFDPGRNVKFITYAVWWVRQAIMHALSEQVRAFTLPAKLSGVAARFGREVAQLAEQLDRAPTTAEIANDLSISESDVQALQRIGSGDVSLNEHVGRGDSEGSELGDLIEQDEVEDVEHELIHRAAAERVRAALHDLDQKEREVVTLRYGLDRDGEPRTLQEIGEALGVSRERIRQIESRAKDKLRRSKRAGELRSYLN
jgi:RNA polymerase primary sigma factor